MEKQLDQNIGSIIEVKMNTRHGFIIVSGVLSKHENKYWVVVNGGREHKYNDVAAAHFIAEDVISVEYGVTFVLGDDCHENAI